MKIRSGCECASVRKFQCLPLRHLPPDPRPTTSLLPCVLRLSLRLHCHALEPLQDPRALVPWPLRRVGQQPPDLPRGGRAGRLPALPVSACCLCAHAMIFLLSCIVLWSSFHLCLLPPRYRRSECVTHTSFLKLLGTAMPLPSHYLEHPKPSILLTACHCC